MKKFFIVKAVVCEGYATQHVEGQYGGLLGAYEQAMRMLLIPESKWAFYSEQLKRLQKCEGYCTTDNIVEMDNCEVDDVVQ